MADKVIRPNFRDRQRRKQPPKASHRKTAEQRDEATAAVTLLDPVVRYFAAMELIRRQEGIDGLVSAPEGDGVLRIALTDLLAAKRSFPDMSCHLDQENQEVVIELIAAEERET